MGKAIDLTGQKFGRLTAVKPTRMRSRRNVIWECLCDCGKFVYVPSEDLRSMNTKSCGCLRRDMAVKNIGKTHKKGPESHNWKGGRLIRDDGYIRIKKPGHPYASKAGYVYEHRLVMEKKLGRYLKPKELVHHANGIPDDNTEENLVLFAKNGPHLAYHNKLQRMCEET